MGWRKYKLEPLFWAGIFFLVTLAVIGAAAALVYMIIMALAEDFWEAIFVFAAMVGSVVGFWAGARIFIAVASWILPGLDKEDYLIEEEEDE